MLCWMHCDRSLSEHVVLLPPQLSAQARLESQLYEAPEQADRQREQAEESRDSFASHAVLVQTFSMGFTAGASLDDEQPARGARTAKRRAKAAEAEVDMHMAARSAGARHGCLLFQRRALRVWPSPGFQPPLS